MACPLTLRSKGESRREPIFLKKRREWEFRSQCSLNWTEAALSKRSEELKSPAPGEEARSVVRRVLVFNSCGATPTQYLPSKRKIANYTLLR